MRFFGRSKRPEPEPEPQREDFLAPRDRIAFVPFIPSDQARGVGILSDSQSGEIHRVFEQDGQHQIDAIPIVRRLLHQQIAARNVGCVPARSDHHDCFFGAHFVLDTYFRRAYRVWISPLFCRVEQLWGPGVDEVRERPFAPQVFSWCDLHDEDARHSQNLIERAVPTVANWGLGFASLHRETGSDVQRRLFFSNESTVRHHARPVANGIESAIEIQISNQAQKRVVLAFEDRKGALKVLGDAGEVPF